MSRLRLAIRNIPKKMDEKQLKKVVVEAVRLSLVLRMCSFTTVLSHIIAVF